CEVPHPNLYASDNSTMSISQLEEATGPEVMVYPNPSDTEFYIEDTREITGAKLYDGLQRLVYSHQGDGKIKIPTGGLKEGLYILRVFGKEEVATLRVMVKH